MKKIFTLIRREYWQQRFIFLYAPLIFLVVFATNAVYSTVKKINLESFLDGSAAMEIEASYRLAMVTREDILDRIYSEPSHYLVLSLWAVLLIYFSLTLYQEKKDQSIFFWKSMPTSDTEIILSKLLAGLVLVPLIFMACIICLHLIILLMDIIYGMALGIDVWNTYWIPSNLFSRWCSYFVYFLLAGFWFLPVFTWFMAVSACARSVPFLWAIGLPFALLGYERFLFERNEITQEIVQHIVPYIFLFRENSPGVDELVNQFITIELLISIILGYIFIRVTIAARKHADIF